MWWGRYVGIPYLDKGRTDQGCDCWGLVRLVYAQELGIYLPSWHTHDGLDDIRDMLKQHLPQYRRLECSEPFSIVLFSSSVTAMHVGVVVDDDRMLHTTQGKDACLEHTHLYRFKFLGYYVPSDLAPASELQAPA